VDPHEHLAEVFRLQETLLQCRRLRICGDLEKVRKRQSMLHHDVLLFVYHFASICDGNVLEIGAYLGGSTTAAAWGIRDAGRAKKLITVEPGGRVDNHRLATKNILRDLKKHLTKNRIADAVTLIEGHSWSSPVPDRVRETLGDGKIGLLILDADGQVKRDLDLYGDLLLDDCWLVIDDYSGPPENIKVLPTRGEVNELVAAGKLLQLGLYGWGTWIGKWKA
jgi:predicted O-methyltransferase YrrM